MRNVRLKTDSELGKALRSVKTSATTLHRVKQEILRRRNLQKTVDQTNKTCTKCKKGKYIETSLHDDWHGVLHCNHCGHEVKRHLSK